MEETVCESAGRGADIERIPAGDVDPERKGFLDLGPHLQLCRFGNDYALGLREEAGVAMVDQIARPVTGTARLALYKGSVTVVGRKAPKSLFDPAMATFEADAVYNQADAEGFIKLNALRLKIRSALLKKKG